MEGMDSLEAIGEMMNHLPNQENLEQFFERIIQGMVDNHTTKDIFSEKDFGQLEQIFTLPRNDLYTVIDISMYIFEKLAFSKQAKSQAKELLEKAKFNSHICKAFESVWGQYGDNYTTSLKQRRVCVENGLDHIDWSLNIPLENSHILDEAKAILVKGNLDPEARLHKDAKAPFVEMTLSTSSSQTDSANSETAKIEDKKVSNASKIMFTKQLLQNFFEELEKVQGKLDSYA